MQQARTSVEYCSVPSSGLGAARAKAVRTRASAARSRRWSASSRQPARPCAPGARPAGKRPRGSYGSVQRRIREKRVGLDGTIAIWVLVPTASHPLVRRGTSTGTFRPLNRSSAIVLSERALVAPGRRLVCASTNLYFHACGSATWILWIRAYFFRASRLACYLHLVLPETKRRSNQCVYTVCHGLRRRPAHLPRTECT